MNQNNDFHNKMIEKYGLPDWLPEGWVYKKSRMKTKLVEGVGINDVEFSVKPNIEGKQLKHKAYQIWTNMLQRAYSDKYKSTNPTYTGVEVCADWHIFSNFLVWFKDNYVEGYQLDKDILVNGNKIYGPRTCIFVPSNINSFLTLCGNSRGLLPIGVTLHQGKFRSRIRDVNLGSFDTPELAHQAWQSAKLERAMELQLKYSDIPMSRVITKLQNDINNNLETKFL